MSLDWTAASVLLVLLANLVTLVWGASSVKSEVQFLKRDLLRVEEALDKIANELHKQNESHVQGITDLKVRVARLEARIINGVSGA